MKDVVSVQTMRDSDRYTVENITSSRELMYRAAKGVFDSVKWHGRIGIVCGAGNNGGDGYALALILKEHKYNCEIIRISEKLSCDGQYYYEKCIANNISCTKYNENTKFDYDIIVDCIFGTGFKGAVNEPEKIIIQKINSSSSYIVSVDINSGLNGDSGLCDICVNSNITVSIGTLKSGLVLGMAKDKIEKLVNCDIGIKIISEPYKILEKKDIKDFINKRDNYSNKGTYGKVALIGGCIEYSGAMKLANISATSVRCGAGIVKLIVPNGIASSVAPYLLDSTLYPMNDKNGYLSYDKTELDNALNGISVVAIGMGMGQKGDNVSIIEHILKNYEIPVIIDADGINTLARMDKGIIRNSKSKIILTPHPKEFERLSNIPMEQILENPILHALEYAKNNNVILLLKGTTTIITDGRKVYLSDTGCSGMARGGSGDVLSGIIAGICASNNKMSLVENVAISAFINGYAAELSRDELCDMSMCASDTAKNVGRAIAELLK